MHSSCSDGVIQLSPLTSVLLSQRITGSYTVLEVVEIRANLEAMRRNEF